MRGFASAAGPAAAAAVAAGASAPAPAATAATTAPAPAATAAATAPAPAATAAATAPAPAATAPVSSAAAATTAATAPVSAARAAAVALAAFAALAACGGARTPAPSGPSVQVRAEIEQAEAAERVRRHDAAREHYRRAVASARDPDSIAFARREYAETLVSWGEYPEAIAQLEGALAARPSAAAWHDLGLLRHNQGDVRGALAALEQARTLAPRDPRPRVALAALRWKTGDRAGAAVEYRALLELPLSERLRSKVQWALDELAKP